MLVGFALKMPEELLPFTAQFRLPMPSPDEVRGIVFDVAGDWGAEHGRRDVHTTNKVIDMLVRNLVGLSATDVRRLALKAINDDGVISESELPEVMRAKYELLGRDGVLSFEYETANFAGDRRHAAPSQLARGSQRIFPGAGRCQAGSPARSLLLGVQGCGKSLVAKAAAAIFSAPLLRLDFSVLYNKYYGETERNLRKAFETAEVMSPCVLWMDEIEKGVSVQNDDDGLSRRILGSFLRGCRSAKNRFSSSPRPTTSFTFPLNWSAKGVLTKSFLSIYPSAQNRRDILLIHLRKRAHDPAQFNLDAIVEATDGFFRARKLNRPSFRQCIPPTPRDIA